MILFILTIIIIIAVYAAAAIYLKRVLDDIKHEQKVLGALEDDFAKLSVTNEKLKKAEKELVNKIDFYTDDLNRIKKETEQEKESFEKFLSTLSKAQENYIQEIENSCFEKEKQCDELEMELEKAENELTNIKNTISAGTKAILEEQKEKKKSDFYRLSLPLFDCQINDLNKLIELRETFSDPVVISKLIWSQYFQKEATNLCNRVLGKDTVCGIYKITNLETKQVYIGQSKNCQNRWKDHIKKGLGINVLSTNKLYKAMLEYGICSFSFELLEECSPEMLNQKEKQWIEIYEANLYGYNSTGGNN